MSIAHLKLDAQTSAAIFGLGKLPPPLINDQDAIEAFASLKFLLDRFQTIRRVNPASSALLTDSNRQSQLNQVRHEIVPAVFLLALYLRKTARPHANLKEGDDEESVLHAHLFVNRMEDVLQTCRKDSLVLEMMKQYSFDIDPTSAARIKTTKLALPELRAAVATNFCPLGGDPQVPLSINQIFKKNKEVELAIVQWQSVQYFLALCEKNQLDGYDIVPLKDVSDHVLKLLSLKQKLAAIVAFKS